MGGESKEYISLQEATKYCNYSQEYLSLRARYGKLKAVKFGRNWVTKKDWLFEYLKNVEKYNNLNNNHKEIKKEKAVFKKNVQPPNNLPIEKKLNRIILSPNLRFAVSVATIFILFFSSGVFGMPSFKNVFQELDPLVTEFSLATDSIFTESNQFYKDMLEEASPLVTEFNKNFDRGVASLNKNPKIFSKEADRQVRNLGNSISYTVYIVGLAGDIVVKEASNSIVDNFDSISEQTVNIGEAFAEYGRWTLKKISQSKDNLSEGYIVASDFLKNNFKKVPEKAIKQLSELKNVLEDKFSAARESYIAANNSLERNFKNGSENTADLFSGLKNVLEDKFSAARESYIAANNSLERNFKNGSEKATKQLSGLGNIFRNKFNTAKDGYIAANDSLERNFKKVPEKLVRGFFNISNFLKDRVNRAKDGYAVANDFVETKLKQGYKAITDPFVAAYNYLTFPWRGNIPERVFVKETSKEELEAIKEEIKTLKTEGLTVREVVTEVSRIVQPVREVTTEKIVARVDDISLALINSQISELQTEMANRLYAPGGVISQQIYVTEPVSSPKIYQENGDIVLQTAGTGNVILSAATGVQIAGKQVVIDSLSTTNPLIYIADPMNVAGDTTIESKLSVGGELTASSIVSQGYVQTGYEGLQLTATSSAPTESLAAGRIYYDSSASNLQYYNGASWSAIGTGSGGAFSTSSDANGNLIYPQEASYDLVVGTSTGVLATATAPFWIDSSTGNLTISGALTSSNVTAASTTNWDALYADGYVPVSLGGTATDTTGWTGFAYVDSGTWGTSTSVETDPLWTASSTEYARYEDSSTTNWNLAYDWYDSSSTGINASSVAWDLAEGWYTASSSELLDLSASGTTAYDPAFLWYNSSSTGINASSTFWDLGYFYASNYNSSSTNYDTTYDIVNASSSNWDLTEGWYTASSSELNALSASGTSYDLAYDWYNSSSTAYLQLIGGTVSGSTTFSGELAVDGAITLTNGGQLQGTFTAGTGLTMPAFTLGGDVDGGGGVVGGGKVISALDRQLYNETNLIGNASFEVGDPPTGWAVTGAGATASRSAVQKKIGSYSVLLTRNGANTQFRTGIPDYTRYQGREITICGWVWTDQAAAAYVYIGDSVSDLYSTAHTGDSTWQLLTRTVTVGAAAVNGLAAGTIIDNNSSAYFDGLMVVEGDSCPAYSPRPAETYGATLVSPILSGNVGVGTTTPAYTLDVFGNLGVNETTTIGGNLSMATTGDSYVYFNAGVDYMLWDDGGDAFFFSNDINTNNAITASNITVASSSAWDLASGWHVASSSELNALSASGTTAYDPAFLWYNSSSTGINASSTFWDLGYFYASNYNSSSTNYDTTYDIVNASSASWDLAYDWYNSSSTGINASSVAWDIAADWYTSSSTAYLQLIGGTVSGSTTFSGGLAIGGYDFTIGTGTAGQVLKDDGTGNLYWADDNNTGGGGADSDWIQTDDLLYATDTASTTLIGGTATTTISAFEVQGSSTLATTTITDLTIDNLNYSTGTNWDTAYYWYTSSSTNYDTTYDIVNASSTSWDRAYGWGDTWNITGNIMSATDTIGALNFGTSTATNYFTIATDTADWFVVDATGLIGIGTTSPSYGLDVHASSSAGYFGVSNILAGDMFLINESGYIGVGTTTPDAYLHIYGAHATSTLTVQQLDSGNIVDFMSTSTSAFTLKSDDYLKYRAGLSQTWGTINDVIIDDFEDNDASDWVSSDTTNSSSSATSTYFRVGDFAFSLYSASGSSAGDTATTAPSTTDWSSYERLSFWIRADYTTTSTDATTTQLISVMLSDSGTTSSSTVTIAEMGKWQYQEWDISNVTSTDKDVVDWTGFRIDNDYGSPTFFIDQIRLYDNDLQTGEMFVDSEGSLAIWGQKSVQIGRTSADEGSLPSIEAGTAVVELNQPLSVDVGGDVGFDYDLQFLNTGLSQIISEGPLMISAGDANHYENLTLTTGGTGDIIMDIASSTLGLKITGSATSSFGSYIFRVLPPGQVEIGNDLTISGSIFPATTTATSSEWSLGTSTAYWDNLYVVNSFVGDIIFANEFKITEAAADAVPQGLFFQNASSSNILFIDEEGNLTARNLIAEKAHLEKLEMVDQATGELWCIWIENGEWVKSSGQCEEIIAESAFIETVDIVDAVDSNSSTSSISAPNTIIISQPLAETLSVDAIIEFFSTKENSTFQCKINDLDWANCVSPQKYSALVPGDYVLQIIATDEQGMYDTTPAVVSWTILPEGNQDPIIPEEPPATTTDPVIPEELPATTTDPIIPEEPPATTTDSTSTDSAATSTTTTPVTAP
ncbi:MAG: hypothetical protein ABH831_00880 [Candidatus Nealsonbacteria bacterium]